MTSVERRTALGLAGVYGFRMLGLFLILPVFALFAEDLPGSTPFLTGFSRWSVHIFNRLSPMY